MAACSFNEFAFSGCMDISIDTNLVEINTISCIWVLITVLEINWLELTTFLMKFIKTTQF